MPDAAPETSPVSACSQAAAVPRVRLFSGLRIVSLCTLASRVLGLVRDMGMAALFGNGPVMDAFSVAFRIPNLGRQLFGEGALATAFMPVFIRKHEQSGRGAAFELASTVLTMLATVLSLFVLVCEIALLLSGRLDGLSPDTGLLINLTALMLPYLVLICLAAQLGALLNALGRFAWTATLPIVLNVIWIAALWWVAPLFSDPTARVYSIAAAVVVAGVAQCAAPLPALWKAGFRLRAAWPAAAPEVSGIARAMFPILLGLSITQINTVSDSLIAWAFSHPEPESARMNLPGSPHYPLSVGTASALYFGQRLYQFPLGVFGVALGTVLFPVLTRHAQRGDRAALRRDLTQGLRLVIAVGFPASAGLMLLAPQLTALLFQHGAFGAEDAQQTSGIIVGYAAGVWAYCGLLIVHRAYYAIGDRMTPLRVGLLAVVVNLVLNIVLIWPFGGPGLAWATALAAASQLATVAALLPLRVGPLEWRSVRQTCWKSTVATLAMCAVCVAVHRSLSGGASVSARMWAVAVPLAASAAVYCAMAAVLGMPELKLLFRRDSEPEER